jgi:two-component response regulator (ARR-A family)
MASRKGLGGEGSASAPHVLAVDDSSVDRAVIASILRSSQFRGE